MGRSVAGAPAGCGILSAMPRVADLGIQIGVLPSGPTRSVLDVPGAGVGHATVWRDEPEPPAGRGIARTGVTVLLPVEDPLARPVPAGGAVLNGAGECTGFLLMQEWGIIATPVFLTSTMQVGRVYDAACQLIADAVPLIGEEVVIPVVAECDDSFLNEVRQMQVDQADVAAAWARARSSIGSDTPPAEGAVGAGTGMSCLGWKSGIGTASRVVPSGHTVGVLLLTNFGKAERLTVAGRPVGRLLLPPGHDQGRSDAGSCIGVVVTDAPLDHAACGRLARRVGLGLARAGSAASHGSGEIFLACATGARTDHEGRVRPAEPLIQGADLGPFFEAVVDASEEAVLNSLLTAQTVTGRSGHVEHAIPLDALRRILAGTEPAA
jgi:D-aminopeptidase